MDLDAILGSTIQRMKGKPLVTDKTRKKNHFSPVFDKILLKISLLGYNSPFILCGQRQLLLNHRSDLEKITYFTEVSEF